MSKTLCPWQCGRPTNYHVTRVCNPCWRDRERVYRERKQREAAEVKKPNRVAAGKRARMALG